MIPHLLRCQGLAVIYYGFALRRLESEAPSAFALLRYNFYRPFGMAIFGIVFAIAIGRAYVLRVSGTKHDSA